MTRRVGTVSPILLLVAGLLSLLPAAAPAQWTENGISVCSATDSQQWPVVAADGAGGAIMTWYDFRSGNGNIYAQRVDAAGNVLWTADGVAVCTAAGEQDTPGIVSDGAGGAIVAWRDFRSGTNHDIYAQRIDAAGNVLWTADGIPVCTEASTQTFPYICSDGAGGAIIAWDDYRSGTSYDIYAQRVDAGGNVLWTADGVAVCTATDGQTRSVAISDGAGGAIVAWTDRRTGNYDIFAQRVDSSGIAQWAADGKALCLAAGNQTSPVIVSDGTGGAIVAWPDARSGQYDIYAQQVASNGAVFWPTDGVALCSATGSQESPRIASDGAGGAIVTWQDNRTGAYDIYAQRVDALGSVQWTLDGVVVCDMPYTQYYPDIASDGAGGAIVVWEDARSSNYDIYVQHLTSDGTAKWTSQGELLSIAPNFQAFPAIASDGAGGAIVAWQDNRAGAYDIYAQRVTRQGYWGYPAPRITSVQDVPGDQGGRVRVSFEASRLDAWPDAAVIRYSVWRSMSPAAATALKAGGLRLSSPAAARPELVGKAYYSSAGGDWELVGTMDAHMLSQYGYTVATLRDSTSADTGWEGYMVSAHAAGTTNFWDSAPDSGYSVDNLAPAAPAALAGQLLDGPELWIHWNPNTEADLSHYAVYRGITADFVPSGANRIGTTADTSFTDTSYGYGTQWYYKVSAWDVHENEGVHSLLTPDQIAGIPGGDSHYSDVLYQNVPNPFISSTVIGFAMERGGRVRLLVFDAGGRLVKVLVDEVRGPGSYSEVWDGSDGGRRRMPSGTYFYRLEAPGWSENRKMTLVR